MRKDNEIKNVKEYSKYPSIFRDLSFLIDKNENFTRLQKEIQKQAKYLINTVIFNVYTDETFAKNEINLVIRLEFQSLNETLTNEVVEKEIEKICGGLQEIYEIKFRN
jgi:phenylalanyl-tRNA synthetase beta chain